jgi:hypothetical protein
MISQDRIESLRKHGSLISQKGSRPVAVIPRLLSEVNHGSDYNLADRLFKQTGASHQLATARIRVPRVAGMWDGATRRAAASAKARSRSSL